MYYAQGRIYDNEINFIKLNQNSRRENIEIINIPESVEQRDLEKHVLEILASIDIWLESYDIIGAHRIGKKMTSKKGLAIYE